MPLRVLILSPNEICYNPRLMKAGDYLAEHGADVTVFNPITGIADPSIYEGFRAQRPWRFEEFDISKRSRRSAVRWALASLKQRIAQRLYRRGGWPRWGFPFLLNKGLSGYRPTESSYDIILINLVDTLPLAAALKKRLGARLVYDSQEFFSGQEREAWEMEWVQEAERRYIRDVDIVVGTTDALVERLRDTYGLSTPAFRVRNAPYASPTHVLTEGAEERPLQLIWHGFQVNYEGRGVNLILDALGHCNSSAALTLQGRLSDEQRTIILDVASRLGIESRVRFKEPAHPEAIVDSIRGFDVGLSAEPGVDENQALTSSNKLFEYMHAGLAVVAPDLPGLTETIEEYDVGLVYRPADVEAFARCIDMLAHDRARCRELQTNARAASQTVTWQQDFEAVYREMMGEMPSGAYSSAPRPALAE